MTEHEHMPRILRTTAKRLIAGKIIPMEEAEDLRDALDVALAGPGPQVVCEVVERR